MNNLHIQRKHWDLHLQTEWPFPTCPVWTEVYYVSLTWKMGKNKEF